MTLVVITVTLLATVEKLIHFANSDQTKRRLGLLIIAVLSLGSILLPAQQVFAAGTITSASLKLSDPRPSSGVNQNVTYTFTWTAATTATLKCMTFTFWTTATGTTEPTGMVTNGSTKGTFTGTGITDANWSIPASPTEGKIQATNTTGDSISSATALTTPFVVPRNPSTTGTFYIQIQDFTDTGCSTPSGGNDSVVIAAPTVAGTLISATINPILTFTVAGLSNGATVKTGVTTENGGGNLNCATSTATAVSFPTNMATNTNYTCGQSLTTTTNAQSGYSVTLRGTHTAGDFLKGSPSTLTITDGTGTNALPAAYGTPTEEFAYTTSEATLSSGTTGRFSASDTWAKVGNNSATSEEVAFLGVPTNADVVNIGYRIRFSGTTEASTYTGTVLYTCTATF